MKMTTACCLLAGTLALAGPASATTRFNPLRQGRYVRAMQSGKLAYDHKDYRAAARSLHQALELRPDSGEALNDLGEVEYRAGKFADARKSFEKSAAADPERAAYQEGNSLYREHKLCEAAPAYKAALRADPNDEDARFNLQLTLDKLKSAQPKPEPDQAQKQQSASSGSKPDQKPTGVKPDQQQTAASGSKPEQQRTGGSGSKPEQQQGGASGSKPQANAAGSRVRPKAEGAPTPATAEQTRPPGAPAGQNAAAAVRPSSDRDDSDRILQYYQNKERQARRQPAHSDGQPQPGQETW